MALQFRFRHGVEQLRDANDLLLVDQRGRTLRLTAPSQPLVTMLRRLGEGGGTLLSLMQGMSSLAPFFTLQQLEQRGWLALELASGEKSLVTLEPQSTVLERCHPPAGAVCIRWSRLIQITPETDGVLLRLLMTRPLRCTPACCSDLERLVQRLDRHSPRLAAGVSRAEE